MHGTLRWSGSFQGDCEGTAWGGAVTLFGGPAVLARGDVVEVAAQLAPPSRFWNDEDPRPREARQRSARSGGVLEAHVVQPGGGVLALIDRLRARLRAHIDDTFPDDIAPMARALVLGESDLSPDDDVAMRQSGLSHLLAVSGMHLVLAVVSLVGGLKVLLARAERVAAGREVGRIAAALGVPLAWVYAEIAGGGGSTRRAAWMLTVAFVARALGRRADGVRAFGWSLLAMAVLDPLAAFDVSFTLSAAATTGLLVFSTPLAALGARLLPGAPGLARSVATSLAATLACAPLLARFAPTLPLGGVLANVVAVPVGEALALPLCLVHALLVPAPAAARGCALVASGALRIVRWIARTFAGMTALAIPVPSPTSWQLVFLVVGFVAWLLARPAWRSPLLAAVAAATLLAEIGARRAGAPRGELRATFFDVGQGDAALVDLPDGSALLLDGGGLVGSPVDTGERVIAPALRLRRRDALSLAILSHPHPDHFTGLARGLRAISVDAFWDTGQGEREGVGGAYAEVLADLRARGVPIVRPAEFCGGHSLGGVRLDVLAPCPDSQFARSPNDNSIVLHLAFGRRAFLFVGDAEREEEGDLLKLPRERLRADVLKVGHHGSRTSSSPAFLAAVGAREMVVPVGPRNRFGHPHPVTMAALAASGARVWRTDHEGAVTISTDGDSLVAHSARETAPSF
jgi:competence protein ComEC